MNTQTQEALKMAIEALEGVDSELWSSRIKNAVDACKEALATEQVREDDVQPAQEYLWDGQLDNAIIISKKKEWQGLSDDDVMQTYLFIFNDDESEPDEQVIQFYKLIEQALKEKNT